MKAAWNFQYLFWYKYIKKKNYLPIAVLLFNLAKKMLISLDNKVLTNESLLSLWPSYSFFCVVLKIYNSEINYDMGIIFYIKYYF